MKEKQVERVSIGFIFLQGQVGQLGQVRRQLLLDGAFEQKGVHPKPAYESSFLSALNGNPRIAKKARES
jgi:hypothetical protein